MGVLVLLGIVAYVVLEWFVAAWLAGVIGWGGVFLTVAVLVIIGAAVMRRAGLAAAQSLRPVRVDGMNVAPGLTQERAGQVGREVGDAGLLFVAGFLIALPGIVTSAVGLLLLIPPLRRAVARATTRAVRRRAEAAGLTVTTSSTTVTGTVVREDVVPPVRGEIVSGEVVERREEPPPSVGHDDE
jgi:UPF0716 protein FxsA